jgi:hypothetical protein
VVKRLLELELYSAKERDGFINGCLRPLGPYQARPKLHYMALAGPNGPYLNVSFISSLLMAKVSASAMANARMATASARAGNVMVKTLQRPVSRSKPTLMPRPGLRPESWSIPWITWHARRPTADYNSTPEDP